MASTTLIETIYGKHHKFEVYKETGGFLGGTSFSIRKNGEHFKSGYSSLSAAVEAARKQG